MKNLVLLAVAWVTGIAPCAAWNQSGHHLVNLLAHHQLPEELKAEYLALLRQHPHFDRHFLGAMPDDVWRAGEADKDVWIIAHAGQWPDLVRGAGPLVSDEEQARYNKPIWHFCDGPLYLRETDQVALESSTLQPTFTPKSSDISDLENAVQAITLLRQRLVDQVLPPTERAVALCWLTHLIADLHQPCHAAALHSEKLYPTGDAGASATPIVQRGSCNNLHALWDDALLARTDFTTVQAKAKRMFENMVDQPDLSEEELNPEKWFHESHRIAVEFVYTQDILAQIVQWEEAGAIGELEINPEYLATMRRVTNEQALVASRRLAALLKRSLANTAK